jgi:hypothetical protein
MVGEEAGETPPDAYGVADTPRRSFNVLIDPKAAETEMRAAGYEPLVPYPGRSNDAWPCRCIKCGHEGRPRLSTGAQRRSAVP